MGARATVRLARVSALCRIVQAASIATCLTSAPGDLMAQRAGGFLDVNVYPMTTIQSDNSATINAGLTYDRGLTYFSLTNIGREPGGAFADLDRWLTEQNVRWHLPGVPALGVTTQALLRAGAGNDALRLGVRWVADRTPGLGPALALVGLSYSASLFPLQWDHQPGRQWQIEHVLRWAPPDFDRIYLAAFADQNHRYGPGGPVFVAEAQLGVGLADGLYAVVEQRHNGFRVGDERSVAIGLQYLVRFERKGDQ